MKLSKDEIQILKWAQPVGKCAVVWPTGAEDPLYLAGKNLERLGFLVSVKNSPEQWTITATGREALTAQP